MASASQRVILNDMARYFEHKQSELEVSTTARNVRYRTSSSAGTPRSNRGGVPAPGCMVTLMVPIVLVLLAAGTLMITAHRQNSTNGRHEKDALEQIARLVESYESEVRSEARNSYPNRARTRAIAQQNYGILVSYEASDRSLTTTVKFFATYEDISFFGTSISRTHRCYSFRFQEGVEGNPHRIGLPLQHCEPT